MAADDRPSLLGGGIFSEHDLTEDLAVRAAPATTDQAFNTIRRPLAPRACWRLEDMRFEFDSSFVKPEAKIEFLLLAAAFGRMGKPVLSVFGHADPVGNDEYNKLLSGRRAQAIYGLLIRSAELWEDLYAHPLGGDNWGRKGLQAMLATVTDSGGEPYWNGAADGQWSQPWSDAIRRFQHDRGLGETGSFGEPAARRPLYLAYMDAICTSADGQPFSVDPSGFLGGGADAGGKADYQGCSRFNPVMVFSKKEQSSLPEAEIDRRNASNRRVLIFLFPPGTSIAPASWPCPRAKEPSAACRQQFWPDGDARRSPKANHREFAKDRDTFACAFYDRMARSSPCEGVRKRLELRLFDATAQAIAKAPYRVTVGSHDSRQGTADPEGRLVEDQLLAGSKLLVEWGFPDGPGDFPFSLEVRLDFDRGDDDAVAAKRLRNLGYVLDDLSANVQLFKHDYGLKPEDGSLDDATRKAITDVHDRRLSKAEFQDQGSGQHG